MADPTRLDPGDARAEEALRRALAVRAGALETVELQPSRGRRRSLVPGVVGVAAAVVVAAVLVGLGANDGISGVAGPAVDDAGDQVTILTSTWTSEDAAAAAQITGELRRDDEGCLLLQDSGSASVPVWPAGWTATEDDGVLLLRDAEGEVVAREGDVVRTGGAYDTGGSHGTPADYQRDPCSRAAEQLAFVMSDVEVAPPG